MLMMIIKMILPNQMFKVVESPWREHGEKKQSLNGRLTTLCRVPNTCNRRIRSRRRDNSWSNWLRIMINGKSFKVVSEISNIQDNVHKLWSLAVLTQATTTRQICSCRGIWILHRTSRPIQRKSESSNILHRLTTSTRLLKEPKRLHNRNRDIKNSAW